MSYGFFKFQTLTAAAGLFIISSSFSTHASTYFLNSPTVRIGGTTTGLSPKNNDNTVDGAIVLTTLRPQEIVKFDLNKLLGPDETMRAGPTSILVPGNLSVPTQKERWGIFNVTLEKPQFGLYVNPQQKEEVFATWVKAPFSNLMDIGRSGGQFNKILPLIKLHAYAFENERDWSRESNLTLRVTKPYAPAMTYRWVRPTLPPDSTDFLLNFQVTPQNRWMLTDFTGSAPQAGRIFMAPELGQSFKTFFARMKFNENGNPSSATAIIHSAQSRESDIEVQGVGQPITGAQITGNQLVWDPVQSPGWMLVISHKRKIRVSTQTFLPAFALENISLGLRSMAEGVQEQWVDAKFGRLDLPQSFEELQTLTLVFIGTEQEVLRPDLDLQDEPGVFTYAKEFRMLRLK